MYRYIALLRTPCENSRYRSIDASLRDAEVVRVPSPDSYALYASRDTPVLRLSTNAMLIGHLFWRDGSSPVEGPLPFAEVPASGLANHLIKECWGEYLLLLDGAENQLTVMRDPSGGVGCVYPSNTSFVTSDISLAVRAGLYAKNIDWDFIRDTLVYPHLKTGRTGLAGIHELLPGRTLGVSDEKITTDAVWTPWKFVTTSQRYRDRSDAQMEVRSAIMSTVKAWAETDRSLLLELSGGLDSSIVAACLLGTNADVSCCNLVTPVPGADERQYARLMSELLGSELHVRTLRIENDEFKFLPAPHDVTPSTWFLQHASNELKEPIGQLVGATSYFSGGGGDTVFCYTKTAAPAADALNEGGIVAGLKAIRNLAELHQCTIWKVGRLAAKKLLGPPKLPRRPEHSFLSYTSTTDVATLHPWFTAPPNALPGDRERIFDLAGNQVFRDGIPRGGKSRVRMPLLSQPVMETCLRVPSWMWISGGQNRTVVRDAFADVLPPDILHRRSKGTFMNYTGAVYRRNRHRLRDHLLTGQLAGHGLLDTDDLNEFFKHDPDSQGDSFMRIFDLCAVENWVRHQT